MSAAETGRDDKPLVRIDGVTKRFGTAPAALDAVSGAIGGGAITGLVGPDGAGKTTLIRLMTGLMLPDVGTMEVLGFDTRKNAAGIQAAIGYMPQRFGLYEDLSVQENLDLYADLRGLPKSERAGAFDELLTFTDLKRFTGRLAGKLSGGMKQKLGLACALLKKPRLLLLDEPGVGVDPISRRDLWKMVENLTKEGIGVLWSTAYLDEAEACDHVLLLNQGKLLFSGKPMEMTERVKDRVFRVSDVSGRRRQVLAELLQADGVIDGVIQGEAIRIVAAKGKKPDIGKAGDGATLAPAPPRFEDAFIDMLGGGPGGRSRLAEAQEPVKDDGDRPVIEAKGLTKRFGDFTAADDISFDIRRGEIFGLLGPNGAGKSTTFKMLCGLLKPTGGEGRVAGFDLRRDAAEARNQLGYMAQKFSLYGDLTVMQNLEFFSGVYGLRGKHRRERIDLMAGIFDFGRHIGQPAKDLPLGLKQRLALACAVMHEPRALFLDEPTSGVDPITRREFWTHINALVEKGVTVLVTTHFMDEAEYCDRISLIYRGRSIALGSPDELKARIATKEQPDPTMEDAFIALVQQSEAEDAA
ncbi:ATP-binding cassette domain-containing protein [Rhizobium leguminosarum]|uniref:ATP-binding cassette domain-containing protein n=1 Tax=Rhizobium leguminosarum TaxID=384 RepID=A0A444IP21_RHILE|nr:ATP-binding cassette domain-containing protein [Rhizobium leguminosarum]ASS56116.1 ABC transporter ATP-binding protein [Rhizobium leguminosarum bv. viciae]AVC51091.1 heme ABC exporter, ATP-binding protein CcmA [Rhizobium leguminosarum bv. viciae]MBB4331339.1 ABC-2 type transport system ATP-binding protein [Rhizobium leguminosarum]MBB4338780.1 ABC-2 type transport system ATP-binding protein [Rhizobium leguminosarum]MBB4356679.1 ABC-2 type transport system ATP-binding protein [Rhizobium legum